MKTYVFSDEHNCDHTYVLAADAQRALDAERARVKELEADSDTWKQAAYDQADAHKATQSQLQAQLRQVEGDAETYRKMHAVCTMNLALANNDLTTLRQLLEDVLHTFGYLRFHRVAGMDGLLYETHNKMSPERTVEACEKRIRATLTPAAGGTRHGTN